LIDACTEDKQLSSFYMPTDLFQWDTNGKIENIYVDLTELSRVSDEGIFTLLMMGIKTVGFSYKF
jgi:hypothetical protein